MKNRLVAAHFLLLLAYTLWGTIGVFTRLITVSATTLVFANSFIALLIVLPVLLITRQYRELLNPKAAATVILLGAILTCVQVLVTLSIQLTTVGNAILSHWTAPLFVLMLGPLILKEKRERLFAVAVVLCLAGLVIMLSTREISFGNKEVIGIALGVLSGLFFACNIIGTKKVAGRFSPAVLLAGILIANVLGTAPFMAADPGQFLEAFRFLGFLAGLAVFAQVLPFLLWMHSIRYVSAQRLSILGYLEPLMNIVFAAIFVAEVPGLRTLAGGILILGSSAWLVIDGSRRPAMPAEDRAVAS